MTYQQTIEYLYAATPQFQRIGAAAYKPGLDTARALDGAFGHPHRSYRVIHVAGTNGKGSTCHTLAAVLHAAGYRVGLYTSPHLIDFRERMRVDGAMITQDDVVDFVERYRAMRLDVEPSFFELTTIMAMEWFAREHVDIAVIETGLGGRLDTTNIVDPILSVITNISRDHTAQLGNTLEAIASEKAGIIKPRVPVVVGNGGDASVREVFASKARQEDAPIIFADEHPIMTDASADDTGYTYVGTPFGSIHGELAGNCQVENAATILTALDRLRHLGVAFDDSAVAEGFANVTRMTGLMGRWSVVGRDPMVVCDTGHNEGGWQWLRKMLDRTPGQLHMVIGFVNDKDVGTILSLMPARARYYFTRASVPRALDAHQLARQAAATGLRGEVYADVAKAVEAARRDAAPCDTVFVGGSTFIVADLLAYIQRNSL